MATLVNDLIDIKDNNAKFILDSIRFDDSLTKKDIASHTNLSFATVSNLCNELKELNVISDNSINVRRVGRMPKTIALNHSKFYSIAIDLQLENMLGFGIVDVRDNVVFNQIFDISHITDVAEIPLFCKKVFDDFMSRNEYKDLTFLGIGIAVPAVFDSTNCKLIYSAIELYEGAPLKEMFHDVFEMYTYIDNIANIRALSIAARFRNIKNIVCLDISQGVGVGIISEGNSVRGKNGYATEIAHIPIGNPDLVCSTCGGRGCVETELSISGMTSYYPEISKSLPALKRWELFVEKMQGEDEKTEAIAGNLGNLIGKLSTIMINLFDPELFMINGYIVDIFNRLNPYFISEVTRLCKPQLDHGLRIEMEPDSQTKVYIALGDILYDLWNPFFVSPVLSPQLM